MPTFSEVVRDYRQATGTTWRISDEPDCPGYGAVLMKVSVTGTGAIVCLQAGVGNLPVRGAAYTAGSRQLEPVTMEVQDAHHA